MKLRYLSIALGLTFPGCSLIPDYHRPEAPVQADWPGGPAYAKDQAQAGQEATLSWQEFFRDPAMRQLIGVALYNNRDLRQAALNVEAYRALHRIERSALFPTVDANVGGSRQRVPDDLSTTDDSEIQSQYSATLGIAYEVDMFGRLHSLERAALQQYLATAETQRAVQIALVSDVAIAYLTWRSDQAQLELASSTLESYQYSLDLIRSSNEVGTASALDVRQARSLVETARVQKALFTRQVAQDVNALQLLLGTKLPGDLPARAPLEQPLASLTAGMPADLLLRRPDIRAAEHRLLAANADIGAARAAFFPSITLTAAAGTASRDLDGLFEGGSGVWSFVPQINLPIFTAGRLSANLDYRKVVKDINVAQYEKSIQDAFREVADGLAAHGTFGEQLQAQRDLVDNNREYYKLANQRYDEGVDNYLVVLDAQRELFAAQQQLLEDHLSQLSSEVSLFKALGGGWDAQPSTPLASLK
ncbi:TPA: efflux transporter outer membrane subunit [Pseudomonas aeruginosa]|uniref:efflux transporter outer membrane subunit n=1 Tax=Pseudomonas aeruginosa TaxID=287 RepID=UPI0005B96E9A|nr:efflux transporter outer membrane subunit [Pseudomonas aeruginosa]ELQ3328414.1 efflux transporter outer membrane subunit [Pseudomonas aeruginosa]ELQ3330051.1 efflux transporter outer membrane subunit [Pseudomonas aeruginosa]KRV32194.1 multidrug transporter [Pseudomonas aeruginosa]KSF44312.1 multidrug transporter [Pseudomonas aeruginosa]KSQ77324.1 multidrug transporter [Pseudomonas aeruginosa]